jgi:arylsulfatase A-like enzyme
MSISNISFKLARALRRWSKGITSYVRVLQCGGLTGACRRAVRNSSRPNVILITLDSLRADRVGYLRDGPTLTPNVDALARESIFFTKAIAQAPWTKPSVGSLLTGLYPSVHGANTRGAFGAQVTERTDRTRANVMRAGVVTLGEILAQHGYTTAAFTGGGFAHAIYQGRGFCHFYSGGHGLRDLFYQCARWFASRPSTSFFVWLHAYDTHRPYRGRFPLSRFVRPKPFNLTNADVKAINSGRLVLTPAQQKRLAHLYNMGVRYADQQMGILLRALRSSGLLERTVLVFTSDHGEALYEHGIVEHWDAIYNEGLRVPLLIRAPGVQPRVVDQYVRLMDLMPTILKLVGLQTPEVQGVNLLPAMQDRQDLKLAALSELELNDKPRALQTTLQGRDYKIVQWVDTGQVTFFDLTADPKEKDNLWGQARPEAEHLLARLTAQLEENRSWVAKFELAGSTAVGESEAGREVEQRLKDLGYIE